MKNPLNEVFSVQTVHGKRTFYPVGSNPTDFTKPVRTKVQRYGSGWGAQIFVGLSVRGVPHWSPEQIRDRVLEIRRAQLGGGAGGGSVTPMLGYWESEGSKGDPREDSVSILIENLSGESASLSGDIPEGTFVDNMISLAKQLVTDFQQESVILRILKANTVQDVIEVATENY